MTWPEVPALDCGLAGRPALRACLIGLVLKHIVASACVEEPPAPVPVLAQRSRMLATALTSSVDLPSGDERCLGAFDYTDRPSIFALQWSPPQPTPTTTLTYFAHGEVNGGAFEVGTPSMRSPTSPRATASMSSEGSLGELEFGDFLATGGLRPGHRRKGLCKCLNP